MNRPLFIAAVEEILGVPKKSLRMEDNRTNLPQWTSLADVQIFALVEEEFGIEPDDELIQTETIGDLLGVMEGRGAFVSGVRC